MTSAAFPQALFEVQYPAPGDPQLAAEVVELLKRRACPRASITKRPFDHGVWVPLSLMYPQADIPVVQVSLPTRGGPALQTRVGHALASLREQGVLLIGSGSITHNLRELDWHAGPESVEPWAQGFPRLDDRETRGQRRSRVARLSPASAERRAQPSE